MAQANPGRIRTGNALVTSFGDADVVVSITTVYKRGVVAPFYSYIKRETVLRENLATYLRSDSIVEGGSLCVAATSLPKQDGIIIILIIILRTNANKTEK